MRALIKAIALISLVASAHFTLCAEITPSSLFSDNAVLQRNQRVPVWGTATSGERVCILFAGQKVSAVAKKGKWRVWSKPLEAGGPFTMTIFGSNGSITLADDPRIAPIDLSGDWKYRATTELANLPPESQNPASNPNVATVL